MEKRLEEEEEEGKRWSSNEAVSGLFQRLPLDVRAGEEASDAAAGVIGQLPELGGRPRG